VDATADVQRTDTGASARHDAHHDAARDATHDATHETTHDATHDVTKHDATHDVSVDAAHDVSVDAAHDVSADAARDGEADARVDAETDSGACPITEVPCPTGCKSLRNDPSNCGACGHACGAGLLCANGTCAANCGSIEVECGLPPPVDSGTKTDAASAHDAGPNPSGEYCADTSNDPLNCGGCGVVCAHGAHSTPVCSGGTCSLDCDPGYSNCDGILSNGCETHTASNPLACGSCTNICNLANAVPVCTNGNCGIGSCLSGFANCDGETANGCETGLDAPTNCGSCGNVCQLANATAGCPAGTCTVASCNPGWGNCDGNPANGCETSTNSPSNCGSCGNVCKLAHAAAGCAAGSCTVASCSPGWGDCDGNPADGCEDATSTDPSNCGGCGSACVELNGTPICVGGVCALGVCNAGFANCSGAVADGCNIDIWNDTNNCGGCGNVCSVANGTPVCNNGQCAIGSCNPGYADCNGSETDGCETPTTNNLNDCGGCNILCTTANATPVCTSSTCQISSCNPGFADCDSNPADGCEVNIEDDNNNCGGCGNSCMAACGGAADQVTATGCYSGTCEITGCATGYQDFDGACADGCECVDSATQSACGNAESLAPAALSPGQSAAPFSSTMMPVSVTEAYFTVTFSGNGSTAFHPYINLTSTNGEFVMDVTADCNNTILSSCGDSTTGGDGVTTWEMQYTAGDPTSYPVTESHFDAIPLPGNNGQVWIRVYRANGVTPTCNPYTITVSD
jgi:hypothetical protein